MRLLALALLLVGIAVQAAAQPANELSLPPDDELEAYLAQPSTTADQAYQIGVRLFDARRYEAAEQAWLRAHSLGYDPNVLVGVADTRQRRDDGPGAVAMLERYLEERPSAPDRASIEARIATLLKSPARLVVRSFEPGQAILLDGVPSGTKTPATLEVEPGEHTVVIVGDGRQLGEQTTRVAYGEVKELDFSSKSPSTDAVEQADEARLAAELAREEEDVTVRRAVIATGTLSAATLVAGTVLGFLAVKKEQDYRDDPGEQTADQGDRLALFADLSFGVAALSAITSFTLFMTHKNKRKRERETARVELRARGAGASATFRF
jgi:hypothetical protein